ncbi:MAG TPA: SDR family NAD(P)-dependent oxidoreductase [Eoetvoesiella sp.]
MNPSTVAIVSGASKGLGRALAQALLSPDTLVITVARSHSDFLAAAAAEKASPLRQYRADLADPVTAERTARQIITDLPATAKRYLLINNAGTVDPVSSASGLDSAAAITAAFSLNVASVMVLTAAFLRGTQSLNADRRILNISSGAGRSPTPGWGVYCATKAALDRYSQVLDAEQHGVRIVSIAPGVINTGMQEHIRASDPCEFPNLPRFINMHAQGQLASPETVAAQLLHYVDRDDFGTTVLDDIRNYA